MNVRSAKKEDFERFLNIKKEFLKDYGISNKSNTFIKKEFDKFLHKCLIILESNNKIIGYLFGSIEKDDYERYGYIWEIFVAKHDRGKGYSTIIKDNFLEYLRRNKIKICRLDVSPGKEAISVYESWGFKTDKYRMTFKF